MKKNGILNSQISKVLSEMRHTDRLSIGDVGLPIPNNVKEIDISLTLGKPSFVEVLKEVNKDMIIEKVILAEEIKKENKDQLISIMKIIDIEEKNIEFIAHEEFKQILSDNKAVIRTGEITPYSNIILQSDVIF